jgi:hypothetical protein
MLWLPAKIRKDNKLQYQRKKVKVVKKQLAKELDGPDLFLWSLILISLHETWNKRKKIHNHVYFLKSKSNMPNY